jgi:hypothetical protein
MANVTLSLQATGGDQTVVKAQYPSVTVPLLGTTPLGVGLYLPSSMHGAVMVRGAAFMGACEIAAGQITSGDVASGASVTVDLTLNSEDCVATGDAGAGGTGGNPTVDAGSGGAGEGTGGEGSGGAMGSGGAPGTGGAMGTGGAGTGGTMMGSGGAMGSGGQPDAGFDLAEPDAPPDVVTPPDVSCEPEPITRTCGRRCDIDATIKCGQTVHCGACTTAGDMCGGPAMPNVCVPCQDMGRACRNLQCGTVVDACGQRVSCGICPLRELCCSGRCQLAIRCTGQ